MKQLLPVLATFILTSAAHAFPAVGDIATFRGTWGEEPIEQTMTYTAFDASSRQFTKLTTTTVGTNPTVSLETIVEFNDSASEEALQSIVTNCDQVNGTNESLAVPAGTFDTCKVATNGGGFVFLGVVPFGVVRMDTVADGKDLKVDLVSSVRGN